MNSAHSAARSRANTNSMKVRDVENGYLIRLEKGEPVMRTLTTYCEKNSVMTAVFHAMGAVENSEIGYYDRAKKQYFFRTNPETREVASMHSNVAMIDGNPIVHAHVVLSASDESLACIGGHVKEVTVAVTLEIFL